MSGPKLKPAGICDDCEAPLGARPPQTRRCPTCATRQAQANRARWRTTPPEQRRVIAPPKPRIRPTANPSGRIDLTGQKFALLTVLAYDSTRDAVAYWRCRCECGGETVLRSADIRKGKVRSCGCLAKHPEGTRCADCPSSIAGRPVSTLRCNGCEKARRARYERNPDRRRKVNERVKAWQAKHRPSTGRMRARRIARAHRRHTRAGYRLGVSRSLAILRTVLPPKCTCGALLPHARAKLCDLCRHRNKRAQKRREKAVRQARIGRPRDVFGDRLEALEVLERDGWTCQECGEPTPRELRGTHHPRAPEVDHTVPLARGGRHVAENLRCLCRECNGAKGDALPRRLASGRDRGGVRWNRSDERVTARRPHKRITFPAKKDLR